MSRLLSKYATCSAVLAVAALVTPRPGRAQEPRRLMTADSIPMELAAALIASGGFAGMPQILVGAMPEWVIPRLALPPRTRVLGSAFLGNALTVALSIPAARDSVLLDMKGDLLKKGWKMPPPQPGYGGFMPAQFAPSGVSLTRLTLCSPDQILTATIARRRSDAADVIVRLVAGPSGSQCTPQQLPPGYPRSSYPVLYNPSSAPDARGDSECGRSNSGMNSTSTTLRTPMAPDAILDHYGKQLLDSLWLPNMARGTVVSGRTWTRPDSTGSPVDIYMQVTSYGPDGLCRDVNMTVRPAKKP